MSGTGKINKAFNLDYTASDRITIPSSIPMKNDFTIIFWIKSVSVPEYTTILLKRKSGPIGFAIQWDNDVTIKDLFMRIDTTAGINQTNTRINDVEDGQWHMCSFYVKDGVTKTSKDGAPQQSASYTVGDGLDNDSASFLINPYPDNSFLIDNIIVMDRAVTDLELKGLYNNGFGTEALSGNISSSSSSSSSSSLSSSSSSSSSLSSSSSSSRSSSSSSSLSSSSSSSRSSSSSSSSSSSRSSSSSSSSLSSSSSSSSVGADWDISWDAIAHYKCNDNAANTTVTDEKGSYDGTAVNNTEDFSVSGLINEGFLLPVGGDVTVPNTIPMKNDFTLVFWIKCTETVDWKSLFNKWTFEDAGFSINFNSTADPNRNIFMRIDTSGGINQTGGSVGPISDGRWHMIAYHIKDGTVKYSLDGAAKASFAYTEGAGLDNDADGFFWRPNVAAGSDFVLDNIIVMDREITDNELKGLYNNRVGTESLSGNISSSSSSSSSSRSSSSSSSSRSSSSSSSRSSSSSSRSSSSSSSSRSSSSSSSSFSISSSSSSSSRSSSSSSSSQSSSSSSSSRSSSSSSSSSRSSSSSSSSSSSRSSSSSSSSSRSSSSSSSSSSYAWTDRTCDEDNWIDRSSCSATWADRTCDADDWETRDSSSSSSCSSSSSSSCSSSSSSSSWSSSSSSSISSSSSSSSVSSSSSSSSSWPSSSSSSSWSSSSSSSSFSLSSSSSSSSSSRSSSSSSSSSSNAGNDSATVLLLHCNGPDESTTFTDDSASGHTVTANGGAKIDTAESVFDGASGFFNGTDAYLTIGDSSNWDFGADDFTIDFRLRFNGSVVQSVFMSHGLDGENLWLLFYQLETNKLIFNVFESNVKIIETAQSWSPSADTWYHIMVVRVSGIYRLFVDGVQIGSDVSDATTIPNFSGNLYISVHPAGTVLLPGRLDEIRISKGVARETGTFTPPTAPYTP